MNNRNLARGIAIAVLVIAAAVAIGLGAYNAGVAHGIAESGRAVAAVPPGATPYVYVWPRYWGFGFGFFPFFFLLFLFFVLRGLIWRGPRWGGWGGGWRGGPGCGYYGYYGGVPPAFDEWHRRAHEQQQPPQSGTV
jgi:hypothetical protein